MRDFDELFANICAALQREQRISYRALRRRFELSDDDLEDLKVEMIKAKRLAMDEDGEILVWTDDTDSVQPPPQAPSLIEPTSPPSTEQKPSPISYTPTYLTEKILTSKSALEGERKVVTVLFADIKDSTELIKDLDPEDAQKLLDSAIHIMMDAVHRFEGTVNQVLGDGIMSIFGAPIAHEDHAARACYAALAMQTAMRTYTEEVRRTQGIPLQIRVGLNSGEVVVRTITSDLHMDYSAVGQTTHLAARMEQLATPGSIVLSGSTLRLVEGLVQVYALGPIPIKGMSEPVEIFELTGASSISRRLQAAVLRGLTKFVGRDKQIEALNQALEQTGAGHGQVVAAIGDAGVGKSRLTYEFIHSHRTEGWRVVESIPADRLYERFALGGLPSVQCRTMLVRCLAEQGGFAEAQLYLEEAIRIAEHVDHTISLVHAYHEAGFLSLCQGDLSKAIPILEHGLELSQSQHARPFITRFLVTLGATYTLLGQVAEAIALLEQAAEDCLVIGWLSDYYPRSLIHLGDAYRLTGRLDEATAVAECALAYCLEYKERGTGAWALRVLGNIAMHRDPPEVDEAEKYYQQALSLAEELGMRPLQAHCHRGLGTVYRQTGQLEQARAALSTAIKIYRDMEMTFWLPETETALAEVEGQ